MKDHGRSSVQAAKAAQAAMYEKYFYAKEHAPHPEREAYAAILEQRKGKTPQVIVDDLLQPVGQATGGDTILAAGPSPNGGIEMIVKKSDGVVVLLMPDMMQVKNTPKGPKNYKPQRPLELPLVRRMAPTEIQQRVNKMLGEPPLPALLIFQGRFSTACRELNLL
jgi:hypothetical protein